MYCFILGDPCPKDPGWCMVDTLSSKGLPHPDFGEYVITIKILAYFGMRTCQWCYTWCNYDSNHGMSICNI